MNLHDEITEFVFADWKTYTILHAMVDAGMISSLECQAEECLLETREFARSGTRGQGDLLTIDHIISQRHSGSHKLENLRLKHLTCNSAWRKGIIGSFLTPEARSRISDGVTAAHVEGRGRWPKDYVRRSQ